MPIIELTLQRKTDSGYPVIAALTRPGGFLPLRREGMLTLDPVALADSSTGSLQSLQYDPLEYGTALGQSLFVDEIRDTFREGLAGGEPLRVLLSVEAPDLRALDWHRLAAPFDGRWRCLASQQNTPFSLSIPSPASAHFPAIGRRDLRALLLVAGPESLSGDYKLAPFDVAATIAGIQEAIGDIPCDILDNPSLDALCAALTQTPYTFLHLVCHGAVNQNNETILYFPKDERRIPTPASDLLNRLSSLACLPHFAFIAACESALPQNGLGPLAGRLVRELGLPAVLAMTDRVSIATAGAIAAPFYAHLYQHGQPDLALAQSLAGLQGAHDLTVPAIFSRLGDRPLFDDNSERALTEKELEFGLAKLAEALPERAPVMDSLRNTLTRRLRSTLGVDSKSLSDSSRSERKETLDQLNSLSLEALDLSFNALCLGRTPPSYDSRSPFRGLESFRPEDATYFFGREALTRKLVQKLNEHNFLAVLGASGSGKSSLVMAGLIPALNVTYTVFRPGAEPLVELEKALQAGPQLLVVDQFEELFTLSAREQRAEFISRILEQSHRIKVVITLRADFLGEVAPFKSLKDELQNHQEIIPPMDETELRRAMEGQAGCAGLRFESDLSQQMLDDVSGEPGAMPLLQHALWTLWTRRHGRWLRAEEYRAFGGVKQAIASTAEAVFARCTDFEKERLRDIFLRLTRLDESADGRDTRRRVLLRDLIPADSDPAATTLLIKQLADARLLVVTGDEVEVAHEALIRHWERLRAWLNDDRDNLRLREGISDDARNWDNAQRDESLLNHRGARLELALVMSKNPRYRLNPVEQAYLDGCVELQNKIVREREIQEKRETRLLQEKVEAENLAAEERAQSRSRQLSAIGQVFSVFENQLQNAITLIRPNLDKLQISLSVAENISPRGMFGYEPTLESVHDSLKLAVDGRKLVYLIGKDMQYLYSIVDRVRTPLLDEIHYVDINISSLLSRVYSKKKHEWKRSKIKSHIETDLMMPYMRLPAKQISDVFENLLENSFRELEKSHLSQTGQNKKDESVGKIEPFLGVSSKIEDNKIIVKVMDNVPGGIPENIREFVFKQPIQTQTIGKGFGIGIGLWLNRMIMDSIGGQIDIESTGMNGTIMKVEIPILKRKQ